MVHDHVNTHNKMMPYNIPIPTLECGMETGGPRGKKGRVPIPPGIGTLSPSPMTRALTLTG